MFVFNCFFIFYNLKQIITVIILYKLILTQPLLVTWHLSALTCCAQTFMSSIGHIYPNNLIRCTSVRMPTCAWSGFVSWFHSPHQLCFAKLHHLLYMYLRSIPAVMIGPCTCSRCATSAPFSGISWNRKRSRALSSHVCHVTVTAYIHECMPSIHACTNNIPEKRVIVNVGAVVQCVCRKLNTKLTDS